MGIYLVYYKDIEGLTRVNVVEANRERLVTAWAKTITNALELTLIEIKKATVIKLRGN